MALVLAEATGARIGAINGLRWCDVSFAPPRIHWRAEFDKRSRDRRVPIPDALAAELKSFQSRLGGIGESWLFPRENGLAPWPREVFYQQLRQAEKRAGLTHLEGGVWHPYRRKWATERKEMPIVDVAAAGGWKDFPTLLKCYQQTDDHSMLRVMASPVKLVSLGTEGRD